MTTTTLGILYTVDSNAAESDLIKSVHATQSTMLRRGDLSWASAQTKGALLKGAAVESDANQNQQAGFRSAADLIHDSECH